MLHSPWVLWAPGRSILCLVLGKEWWSHLWSWVCQHYLSRIGVWTVVAQGQLKGTDGNLKDRVLHRNHNWTIHWGLLSYYNIYWFEIFTIRNVTNISLNTENGPWQVCPLSPYLFNTVLHVLMRTKSNRRRQEDINRKRRSHYLYLKKTRVYTNFPSPITLPWNSYRW